MTPSEFDSLFNDLDQEVARLLLELQEDQDEFLRKYFENLDKDIEILLKNLS